jgi:deoxyribonuclease V
MTGPLSGAKGLFAAVDVHYLDDGSARAALVAARDQRFSVVTRTQTAIVGASARYQPGEFYLRELPPLRAVISAVGGLALIVVDGYVDLDPAGRPGLGAHVHAEFGVPVVGVAKSPFRTATHAIPVCRGQSSRPLYVTAAGMAVADAAYLVAEMAGRFRLPDALKHVDRLARGLERPSCSAGTARSGTLADTADMVDLDRLPVVVDRVKHAISPGPQTPYIGRTIGERLERPRLIGQLADGLPKCGNSHRVVAEEARGQVQSLEFPVDLIAHPEGKPSRRPASSWET